MIQHTLTTYQAGLLQSRAYRKLTVFMNEKLKESGLSLPEWAFLGIMYETDEMRLQELAGILDVEPPFATRLAGKLQKNGYVTKAIDASDSRAKLIALTPQGKERVKSIEKKLRVDMKKYLADITPEELNVYITVLGKISRMS